MGLGSMYNAFKLFDWAGMGLGLSKFMPIHFCLD